MATTDSLSLGLHHFKHVRNDLISSVSGYKDKIIKHLLKAEF